MKFSQKNIENWRFWKTHFFWVGHFEFCFSKKKKFLLYFHENQSKVLKYQAEVKIFMITMVSIQKSLPPNISAGSVVLCLPPLTIFFKKVHNKSWRVRVSQIFANKWLREMLPLRYFNALKNLNLKSSILISPVFRTLCNYTHPWIAGAPPARPARLDKLRPP